MPLISYDSSELLRDRKGLEISVTYALPTCYSQVRLRLLPRGSCLGYGNALSIGLLASVKKAFLCTGPSWT
jgi:hypothetical protein